MKIAITIKKTLATLIAVAGVFLLGATAHASVVLSQTTANTTTNNVSLSTESFRQILATSSITSSVSSIEISGITNAGGTTNTTGSITCPGSTARTWSGSIAGSATTTATFNFDYPFDGSTCTNNVIVTINHNGGASWRLAGSNTDTIYGYAEAYTGGTASPVQDLYFKLYGIELSLIFIGPQNGLTGSDFSDWGLQYSHPASSTITDTLRIVSFYNVANGSGFTQYSATTTRSPFGSNVSEVNAMVPKAVQLQDGEYSASAAIYRFGENLFGTTSIQFTVSSSSISFAQQYNNTVPDLQPSCENSEWTIINAACKAVVYLFVPSYQSDQKVVSLNSRFASSAPFSVVYDGFVLYRELTASVTPTSYKIQGSINTSAYITTGVTTTTPTITFVDISSISQYPFAQTVRLYTKYILQVCWSFGIFYMAVALL